MAQADVRIPLLADRAALWQATVDAVDAPLFLLQGEKVVGANERAQEVTQLYGDLIGSGLTAFGPDVSRCVADLLAETRFAAASAVRQVEDRGSGVTWDVAVRVLADDLGTIVMMRDVTNVVALESTARRNERVAEMGRLVANVAHEVRNPLFSMTATVDALEARLGAAEPLLARYLGPLRLELRRITALMQDLLEYGKPPVLDAVVATLKEPVTEAVARVSARAHAKRVTIMNHVTGREGAVLIDCARMAQAFQNLLENAIHHSPAGSAVAVASWSFESAERWWLCCSVEDSGPGFTEESRSLLFEPFYTTRPGGTGLGLSIVQRIVSIHGGRVFASNREEGGARVALWLPLREGS